MLFDILGNTGFCRYCGKFHANPNCHEQVPELMKQQIEFEKFSLFLLNLPLNRTESSRIFRLAEDLKKEIGIPTEKLFIAEHSQAPYKPISAPVFTDHHNSPKSVSLTAAIIELLNEKAQYEPRLESTSNKYIEWLVSL